jgi:hypothetical protein
MHKRTTPKIFGHAEELHRNLTPAEARLWSRLWISLPGNRRGCTTGGERYSIHSYISWMIRDVQV